MNRREALFYGQGFVQEFQDGEWSDLCLGNALSLLREGKGVEEEKMWGRETKGG